MELNIKNQICPLCKEDDASMFFRDRRRDFFLCPICNLIFVSSLQFLSSEAEKAEYDLHQNAPNDQGYRQFLSRIFIPMQEKLSPGSCGLDFGAGPGPTLSVMFEEAGHFMAIYDHFYSKDSSVLEKQYDFITATEVVEHLHNPRKELDRLWSCLKTGGSMGVMTKLTIGREAFAKWHYKNDLTHVCFFSRLTLKWLAARWQAELTFVDKDAAIFFKRNVG